MTETKTTIVNTENVNIPENEIGRELGECRKHPPAQIPIMTESGKLTMLIPVMGGSMPVVVQEFPPCIGKKCEYEWCTIHNQCGNLCRHEIECHGEFEEEGEGESSEN